MIKCRRRVITRRTPPSQAFASLGKRPDGPLPEGIEAQTRQVVENLRRVLAGSASGLDQAVFARVYLTQFERDYAATNTVYESYFAPALLPGRTCIGVTALARGSLVEIDLLARKETV